MDDEKLKLCQKLFWLNLIMQSMYDFSTQIRNLIIT